MPIASPSWPMASGCCTAADHRSHEATLTRASPVAPGAVRKRRAAAMSGLCRPADRIHSNDESFALEDFYRGTEVMTRLLHEMAL